MAANEGLLNGTCGPVNTQGLSQIGKPWLTQILEHYVLNVQNIHSFRDSILVSNKNEKIEEKSNYITKLGAEVKALILSNFENNLTDRTKWKDEPI